ncbi:MAG: hypothetical protein WC372_12020, partial [Candidatus Neomarinimicrobiota bacterium]
MNSDVRIRYNNTDYDFQLAIDPRTLQKVWQVTDSRAQSQIFTSEVPRNAVIPPSKEEIIDQDYFYGGAGQVLYDEYKRRYYSGPADTRIANVVTNPPKLTKATITKPASVPLRALRNAGAEEGATTAWTASLVDGTHLFSADAAVKNSGSYSLKYVNNAGSSTFYIYQDLENYANLRGKKITASAYLKAESNCTIYVTIDDGVGTTDSDGVSNGGFTQKSVTHTVNAAATKVRIEAKIVGTGTSYMDDVTITIAGTALNAHPVVAIEDFSGYP